MLFLTAGVTALVLLLVPGIENARGAKLTGKDRALSTLDWAPDIAA